MNTPATEDFAPTEALELRVLHGPQAGSTLPFEQGESYTLGTADTCAVLLAGTQIEAEHVALSADGDGIQVTLLQGKVMTIDRGEVSSGQVMSLGTVLRLGRVKLTVDSVDAPWPHDDALEEPELPPAPLVDTDAAEHSRPDVPLQAPAKPAPRSARARGLMPSFMLGTAAMLLMGAAVAAWVTADKGQQAVADTTGLQAEAPAPAASARAPEVRVTRVMPDSERLAVVTQFVEKRRVAGEMELNVEKGASGALRIVGAAATAEKLAALTDAARTELADAAPVNFAVLLRSELPARFEDRLRSVGLGAKVKVLRRDPRLELQAVLTGPEVRVWENLFLEFTRDYGTVLTVVAQVQHERDTLQAHIETVVGGASPYLVTTGGNRIAPGGMLDGRTLMAIRDGEVVFSDGLRVRYGN
jgi:hypothetical protein